MALAEIIALGRRIIQNNFVGWMIVPFKIIESKRQEARGSVSRKEAR
jgi:hypothetical protein